MLIIVEIFSGMLISLKNNLYYKYILKKCLKKCIMKILDVAYEVRKIWEIIKFRVV